MKGKFLFVLHIGRRDDLLNNRRTENVDRGGLGWRNRQSQLATQIESQETGRLRSSAEPNIWSRVRFN